MEKVFHKTGCRRQIATEATSLLWLAQARGAPTATLVRTGDTWLETDFLRSGCPSRDDALVFGRALARTHSADAGWWAQPPPGLNRADSVLASLPAQTAAVPTFSSFGQFYAEARVRPYISAVKNLDSDQSRMLHRACDAIGTGRFDSAQPALCNEVARIHGDLWGGNVVWAAMDGRTIGTLIDPCAHGGHGETDLSELALFGCPYLDSIIAGYHEVSPLATGWQDRVPLHQLHMIIVHAVLFGGDYIGQALHTARLLSR